MLKDLKIKIVYYLSNDYFYKPLSILVIYYCQMMSDYYIKFADWFYEAYLNII